MHTINAFIIYSQICPCIVKKTKINKKEAGFGPFLNLASGPTREVVMPVPFDVFPIAGVSFQLSGMILFRCEQFPLYVFCQDCQVNATLTFRSANRMDVDDQLIFAGQAKPFAKSAEVVFIFVSLAADEPGLSFVRRNGSWARLLLSAAAPRCTGSRHRTSRSRQRLLWPQRQSEVAQMDRR